MKKLESSSTLRVDLSPTILAAIKLEAANIGITYIILSVRYAVIYVGTNTMIACSNPLVILWHL